MYGYHPSSLFGVFGIDAYWPRTHEMADQASPKAVYDDFLLGKTPSVC